VARLILLFTVVPLIELLLLTRIGAAIGFANTVLLVVGTGLLGSWLARLEGGRVWRQWQDALARGQMPAEGVLGGVLMLIGGVLLITPGVLTDVTGLLLLLPPTRRFIGERWVRPWLERRIEQGSIRVVDAATAGAGFQPEGFPHGDDWPISDWAASDWPASDWPASERASPEWRGAVQRQVLTDGASRGGSGRVIDADFEVREVDDDESVG
jgi:UPF0716 protein FxsA